MRAEARGVIEVGDCDDSPIAQLETVDGKVKIRLTFFKYTLNTRELQDLSGGNGQLKNLVAQYTHRTKGFKGTAKAPVIIVTDCDRGAVHLFEEVSKIVGKTVAGADDLRCWVAGGSEGSCTFD